jgi:CRP-like cAMP-binding protein
MMTLQEIISHIYPVPAEAQDKLLALAEVVTYPKHHVLFRADRIDHHLYFIKKGIARAFTEKGDTSITFFFGLEGDPVLSMKSYVSREKSYEDIELLEESELYHFDGTQLEVLYNQDIHIANWGRKLAEKELAKTEERLIARQFRTAAERYAALLQETPALLRRVPLGHIASYLGITQVSLSRIRKEL